MIFTLLCVIIMTDRVAVALAGSTVLNAEGEEMEVKKTSVGGVMSDGMLCDSRMFGW
jgi:hypothetical protein